MLPGTYTATYDDGSTLTFAGDTAVGGTDYNGNPFVAAGSSVVDQASALFNYGARAWLDARLRPQSAAAQNAPAASQPKPLSAQLSQIVPLALLAALGYLAYRALK